MDFEYILNKKYEKIKNKILSIEINLEDNNKKKFFYEINNLLNILDEEVDDLEKKYYKETNSAEEKIIREYWQRKKIIDKFMPLMMAYNIYLNCD